ncbi:MAG TPA: hypothetical protein VEK57_08660 [Thermoanaerobaculia bacterium]|nr:hypothetical protein [Thermoanaerobaculia bacterium]
MRSIFVLTLLVTVAACNRETRPAEPASPASSGVETTTVAGKRRDLRNAQISVTTPLIPSAMASCNPAKTEYAEGEAVQLLLKLNESPVGLVVGARVRDDDEEIAYVTVPAEGKKELTVTVEEKLDAGTYRLEGYWGGNLVCEHDITIR